MRFGIFHGWMVYGSNWLQVPEGEGDAETNNYNLPCLGMGGGVAHAAVGGTVRRVR